MPATCAFTRQSNFTRCSHCSLRCSCPRATRKDHTCSRNCAKQRTVRFSLWRTLLADTHSNIWLPASQASASFECCKRGCPFRNTECPPPLAENRPRLSTLGHQLSRVSFLIVCRRGDRQRWWRPLP